MKLPTIEQSCRSCLYLQAAPIWYKNTWNCCLSRFSSLHSPLFFACKPLSKIRTGLYRKDARRLKKLGIQFICIPAVAVVSETIALWQGAKSIEIISNFGNVTTDLVLILVSLVSATIQRRSISTRQRKTNCAEHTNASQKWPLSAFQQPFNPKKEM